jgi:mRNA interferase YafQ
LKISLHNRFKKDVEKVKKRGKDIEKLKTLVQKLRDGIPLGGGYRLHPLKGKFQGQYECHLEDDWLVIYEIDKIKSILTLIRTGTHDDLGV